MGRAGSRLVPLLVTIVDEAKDVADTGLVEIVFASLVTLGVDRGEKTAADFEPGAIIEVGTVVDIGAFDAAPRELDEAVWVRGLLVAECHALASGSAITFELGATVRFCCAWE
jgi:hypothetical protein